MCLPRGTLGQCVPTRHTAPNRQVRAALAPVRGLHASILLVPADVADARCVGLIGGNGPGVPILPWYGTQLLRMAYLDDFLQAGQDVKAKSTWPPEVAILVRRIATPKDHVDPRPPQDRGHLPCPLHPSCRVSVYDVSPRRTGHRPRRARSGRDLAPTLTPTFGRTLRCAHQHPMRRRVGQFGSRLVEGDRDSLLRCLSLPVTHSPRLSRYDAEVGVVRREQQGFGAIRPPSVTRSRGGRRGPIVERRLPLCDPRHASGPDPLSGRRRHLCSEQPQVFHGGSVAPVAYRAVMYAVTGAASTSCQTTLGHTALCQLPLRRWGNSSTGQRKPGSTPNQGLLRIGQGTYSPRREVPGLPPSNLTTCTIPFRW